MKKTIKNQATNPRPRNTVKDKLNDRARLFFKTNGSSILIGKDLTIVSTKILCSEFKKRIEQLGGNVNGTFYSVR